MYKVKQYILLYVNCGELIESLNSGIPIHLQKKFVHFY
jgi:hypothetical protein